MIINSLAPSDVDIARDDTSSIAWCLSESSRCRFTVPAGKIVSLWDMLRFNANVFVGLTRNLSQIEVMLASAQSSTEKILSKAGSSKEHFNELLVSDSTLNSSINVKGFREEIAGFAKGLCEFLVRVEDNCEKLDLQSGISQIKRLRELLNAQITSLDFYTEWKSAVKELSNRIEDELRLRIFFFVPTNRAKFSSDEPHPFGEIVSDKVSRASENITEARKCFAAGRFTATVFHLMLVMELGVLRLAKKLKITANLHHTWGQILGQQIDPAISALPITSPKEREKKSSFQEVSASLHAVKDAWRNRTMHPKKTYTEEEALVVFQCVEAFMRKLAETL